MPRSASPPAAPRGCMPPLVGAFGVKGKLARPATEHPAAGQGRRKAEAGRQALGRHGHDACTNCACAARAGRGVESGGGKGSLSLSIGFALSGSEIYSAQCPAT